MIKSKMLYIMIKVLVAYLTLLSALVTLIFVSEIGAIFQNLNIAAICALFVNLFLTITNVIFLFRKNNSKDLKIILLYNFIFCLISGIVVRIGGFPFANNLGTSFSIGYIQNDLGNTFTMDFHLFDMFMNFPENISNLTGFSIQINLIMWGIGFFLISRYKKADKIVERTAISALKG